METFTVNQLAELTKQAGDELGYEVTIKNIENPRVEQEEHYYNPSYQGLIELGVEPNYLTKESMKGMLGVVSQHKNKIREEVIYKGVKW
jgi:UDP-sulfoquinovose synthase